MGMPYLNPNDVTDTVIDSSGAPMPNSRSSSPRNLDRFSPDEFKIWLARLRTGSSAMRSIFTASGRA